MMPHEIGNYDVVVVDSDDFLLADESHVGNKRFEVFLTIHREAYDQASSTSDYAECERIVDTIVEIVCQTCVPKGRFLEQSSDEEDPCLRELSEMEARGRVHQALSAANGTRPAAPRLDASFPERTESTSSRTLMDASSDADTKRRRRGSHKKFHRSISESMVVTSASRTPAPDPLIDLESLLLEDPDLSAEIGKDEQEETPITRPSRFPPPLKQLHRSATEPRTSNAFATANANLTPADTSLQSSLPETSMDVVFASRSELATTMKHVGNNRFSVLLDVHLRPYIVANEQGRARIVRDIVDTVSTHWSGKFLVQTNRGFQELEAPQAKSTVAFLLANRQPPSLSDPTSITSSSTSSERGTSTPSPPPSSALFSETAQTTQSLKRPVHLTSSQTPAQTIDAAISVAALHDPMGAPDIEKLRSEAVKNLKARQVKKELAKRLGRKASSESGLCP